MRYLYLFIFLVGLYSCSVDEGQDVFQVISGDTVGIDFNNSITETESSNIIQYLYFYNGAGIGTADFNGDNLPDLVLNANQRSPAIYLNTSKDNISFQNISEQIQMDTISGWGTGVSIADVNGDGWPDIYLSQIGNYKNFVGRNRLLIHKGMKDGIPKFEDQTESYGLSFSGLSTQSAFFDYDLDGDLDMYLLNHSTHQTSNYAQASQRNIPDPINGDRLYRNDGDRFENITEASGIYSSKIGYGLGIAISDLDKNGYPDIYIGNDFHENDYVYWNEGGTFREDIRKVITKSSQFSMGVDIADINNDGYSDIMTLDMLPEDEEVRQTSVGYDLYDILLFKNSFGYHDQYPQNHLHINSGLQQSKYSELAAFAGVEASDWSWSTLIEDFNLDGNKDIFISNGILRRPNDLDYLKFIADDLVQNNASDLQIAEKMPPGKMPNVVYLNQGDYRYTKTNLAELGGYSTGAIYADFDNDGDQDIITNNINQSPTIYKNQTRESSRTNYLKLKLRGSSKNKFGLGSKVEVVSDGSKNFYEVFPQRGFMSSSTSEVIVGLGEWETVDLVRVTWPNQEVQTLQSPKINQTLSIVQAENNVPTVANSEPIKTIFRKSKFKLPFVHKEDTLNDLQANLLAPQLYSRQGPALAVGDIDGDAKEDLFFSGSLLQPSTYFTNGEIISIDDENTFEDIDATLTDLNGDNAIDLYIAGGGNLPGISKAGMMDRVLINRGSREFDENIINIQNIQNSSCVAAADYDQDGDVDLFVGTRSPQQGNKSIPESYILINDGSGRFPTKSVSSLGWVTDAAWGDMDGDDDEDLIVVGDWMPITILVNKDGKLIKKTIDESKGWWRSVKLVDLDNDGDQDIVAGNFGLNNNLHPSKASPVKLHLLDNNRSYISYQNGEPLHAADELTKQIPEVNKYFDSYKEFAALDANSYFENQKVLEVYTFETSVYFNDGAGNYTKKNLPRLAQLSSTNCILAQDVNDDGLKDLILAGNEIHLNTRLGKNDASKGILLLQNEDHSFEYVDNTTSGLAIDGMVRSSVVYRYEGKDYFIFGVNDGAVQIYELN